MNNKAYLIRTEFTNECTRGYFLYDDLLLYTLELPWQHNLRNVSCIPTGKYQARYLDRSASGRYKRVYHIQDVPERNGILIHAGNTASDIRGCILLGTRYGYLGGQRAVLNSRSAVDMFANATEQEDFELHIREVSNGNTGSVPSL